MPGKGMKARARWQAVSLKATWLACLGQPDAGTTDTDKAAWSQPIQKAPLHGSLSGTAVDQSAFGPAAFLAAVPGQPGPGKAPYIP